MREMSRKYAKGFYGGKFLPFHKGHAYCIDQAAKMCNELYVIMFFAGDDEKEALRQVRDCSEGIWYEHKYRSLKMKEYCKSIGNVNFFTIDCRRIKTEAAEKGIDTWDAETPHVLEITGGFDAVFSSEPGYGEYFKRAYPNAKHVLIDVPRVNVPISGTEIRKMEKEEGCTWLAPERR